MLTETALVSREMRDADKIMRVAMRTATRLSGKLRARLIEEIKTGGRFYIRDFIIRELAPMLSATMLAGHVAGYRRENLTLKQNPEAQEQTKKANLSQGLKLSLIDDAVKALNSNTQLELDKLQAQYDSNALRILNGVSDDIEQSLRQTVTKLVNEGSHISNAVKVLGSEFDRLGLSPVKDYKLEAIFRTQMQLAYSAGKWQADQSADIQEILWGYKYVTIGDDRVRDEHIVLEGTTLPKDDPFWDRFFPPNGWQCRCSAIPIFKEVEIVKPPTTDDNGQPIAPDKGFDFNPGRVLNGTQSSLVNLPKKVDIVKPEKTFVLPAQKITQQIIEQGQQTPARKVDDIKIVPEPIINSVSNFVITGASNEMYQRNNNLQPKDRVDIVKQTVYNYIEARHEKTKERVQTVNSRLADNHTKLEGIRKTLVEKSEKYETLTADLKAAEQALLKADENVDALALLINYNALKAEHDKQREQVLNSIALSKKDAIKVDVQYIYKADKTLKGEVEKAKSFFERVLSNKHGIGTWGDGGDGLKVKVQPIARIHKGRAYYSAEGIHVNNKKTVRTIVHEIGHAIESLGEVHELAKGFLYHRIGQNDLKSLWDLSEDFRNSNQAKREYVNEDDFGKAFGKGSLRAAYVGKYYEDGTEIISMGVELLYLDPVGFAKNDPEYFRFIVGVLNGDLL